MNVDWNCCDSEKLLESPACRQEWNPRIGKPTKYSLTTGANATLCYTVYLDSLCCVCWPLSICHLAIQPRVHGWVFREG